MFTPFRKPITKRFFHFQSGPSAVCIYPQTQTTAAKLPTSESAQCATYSSHNETIEHTRVNKKKNKKHYQYLPKSNHHLDDLMA